MKSIITSIFLLFLGLMSYAQSGMITIPDANFKKYLVEIGDRNNDGEISSEEALEVEVINCEVSNIESLEGIEYFPNP